MKNLILISSLNHPQIHLISQNHFVHTIQCLFFIFSETTFHLQKPHFFKASIAIIDMPTFSIIYIHHTTIKLEIATAKQWNNAILSCSPKTRTSKSDIALHSISNRIFFNLFMVSLPKVLPALSQNDQHFPFLNILAYLKSWIPVPLIQRQPLYSVWYFHNVPQQSLLQRTTTNSS